MVATERRVVAAQHDPGRGPGVANVINDLRDARVPVRHHGLDENVVERTLAEEFAEESAGQAEPPEIHRNVF